MRVMSKLAARYPPSVPVAALEARIACLIVMTEGA